MSKSVSVRLSDETYEVFREAADAQQRSLSNFITTAALAGFRQEQFADEEEMSEILGDSGLVDRLRKGSRDAAARKGRFVE